MHKIDSPSATGENEFTDGDSASGILATEVWSKWLNMMQRELVAICAAAGITLDDANDAQVLEAIGKLMAVKQKLVPIGPWDMQSDSQNWDIDPGVEQSAILGIRAVHIFTDEGTTYGSFPLDNSSQSNDVADGWFSVGEDLYGAIKIRLNRSSGGLFDNAAFSDDTMNRGYVVLEYI